MTKYSTKLLLVGLLCLMLLTSLAVTAQAQSPTPATTPTPTAVQAPILSETGNVISFSQLLKSDMTLNGPFDSNALIFALPASWQLTNSPQLDLAMAVSFNTALAGNGTNLTGAAGSLTIRMNTVLLGVVPLTKVGEVTARFQIPLEAMKSTRTDGLMELRFTLDSSWACTYDENIAIAIHTSSTISLPHTLVAPNTDLAQFPSPIFQQDSAFPNSALLVVPDHPSVAELQGAMTVAAGLGNLTSGGMALDIVTLSQLTPQQVGSSHLIFVGKASSLAARLQDLQLPMPVVNGQFKNTAGGPDDGIIQMVDSPWSTDKAALVISGNTDQGTLKAAQAMTTGAFRTDAFPNLAVVQQVHEKPLQVSVPTDQTLQDLGYTTGIANSLGVNYLTYTFYIPPGQTLTSDAYFELLYSHSSLLNYTRSGIVALLNGQPIGSVAFSDKTASIAVNSTKFSLPPALVHTGRNSIELRINLIPQDLCTSPNLSGTYANIWPGSSLHLPLAPSATGISSSFDLTNYPAPFSYDSTLAGTAFVLPKDDLPAWRAAVGVANYLGSASQGNISLPAVFYADNLPASERANYDLLVIGRASQLPIISEINSSLPAPFASNSDVATEPQMQVTFRISPDTTVGYVELLPSPWNNTKEIIAALGNTEQGVTWAAAHLIAPLSFGLKGNFAVINNTKVTTMDTRVASIAPLASTAVPNSTPAVQAVAPALNFAPVMAYRPGWLLPALIVTLVLILITIFAAIYLNWMHHRSGKNTNPFGKLFGRDKER